MKEKIKGIFGFGLFLFVGYAGMFIVEIRHIERGYGSFSSKIVIGLGILLFILWLIFSIDILIKNKK